MEFRCLVRNHRADDFRWALTGGEHDPAGEIKRRIFLAVAYLLFHLALGQAEHDAPYACPAAMRCGRARFRLSRNASARLRALNQILCTYTDQPTVFRFSHAIGSASTHFGTARPVMLP